MSRGELRRRCVQSYRACARRTHTEVMFRVVGASTKTLSRGAARNFERFRRAYRRELRRRHINYEVTR